MTTAAFVRVLFRKDVRALRYPLLLLLLLAISFILLPQSVNQTEYWALVPVFGGAFMGLAAFLLTIPVIQSDPAGREFRFLLTRPIPSSAVGIAKALFIVAFVLLPYWLGVEYMVACSHVPFTLLDHILLLIQTVASFGASLGSLVLLSVFLRNALQVVLGFVVISVVPSFLSMWWQQWSLHAGVLTSPYLPDLEHERLSQIRTFLSAIVFLSFALFAILLRYRTKRFRVPLFWAVGGYVLSQFAFLCPYDCARVFGEQSSHRSMMTPEQLGRIHMTLFTEKGHHHTYDLNGGDWNGIHYVILNQSVQLEGLEPPYFVQTADYHAVITLRSGKTITSNYADSASHGGVGGLNPSFMAVVAGVLPSWPYHNEQLLDLLVYEPRSLPDEDITGATVKGVITLDVRRAYVAGSIPLRPNASFGVARRRYEITRADFSGDGVKIGLNKLQVPLVLRGDLINRNSHDEFPWLAVYRPFSESLWETSSGGSGGGSDFIVHVSQPEYTYKSVDKNLISGWRQLPPDWASGAELVFVGSDPCGQVTLPYEIDNVDLHYRF